MFLSSISTSLNLHDTRSWVLKHSYGCDNGTSRDTSWSDDGKYMLQVNAKGLAEVLYADKEVHSVHHIPLEDTWTASFHRDGHRNIAIGTKTGSVMIWDTKNRRVAKTFPRPTCQSSVEHLSFNASNTSLAATTANGDTVIYGLNSNIPIETVKLPFSKNISVMKFHHKSRSLLGLATEEGHVVLRDIIADRYRSLFRNVHASSLAYSLVNKNVMISSGDKLMHVYDVRHQSVVSTTRSPHILTSLSINIDNQVALGTKNGAVLIYDMRDLDNPLKTLKGHNNEVAKVAFQPLRKKGYSREINLHEDKDTLPVEIQTPVNSNRNSDMFHNITNAPLKDLSKKSSNSEISKDDSFLALMGLDDPKKIFGDCKFSPIPKTEKQSAKQNELDNMQCVEAERDTIRTSTPIHSNTKLRTQS